MLWSERIKEGYELSSGWPARILFAVLAIALAAFFAAAPVLISELLTRCEHPMRECENNTDEVERTKDGFVVRGKPLWEIDVEV
jgi:hypothetical protein